MLLDKSIFIRAPPEAVYRWLCPSRHARWDPSLVRSLGDASAPGERFGRVARTLGHRFEMEAEATDVQAGRLFAWRQVRGDYAAHRGAYHLDPVPGGTRVRLVADVEYPYVMPRLVTEAELRRIVSEEADEALFNLKALAEAAATAVATSPASSAS